MDPSVFLITFNNLVIPKVAENIEVKKVAMNSLPPTAPWLILLLPPSDLRRDAIRIVRSTWHWGMDSKNGSATKIEFVFAFLFQFSTTQSYGLLFSMHANNS